MRKVFFPPSSFIFSGLPNSRQQSIAYALRILGITRKLGPQSPIFKCRSQDEQADTPSADKQRPPGSKHDRTASSNAIIPR